MDKMYLSKPLSASEWKCPHFPPLSFPLVGALRLSALHHPHRSHCKSHHMVWLPLFSPAVLHKFLTERKQAFSLPHPGVLSVLRAVFKPNLSPGHTFIIKSFLFLSFTFKLLHISIDVSTTSSLGDFLGAGGC